MKKIWGGAGGQCLTSSRAEISKKICGPNWGGNDLFYSNVVKRPLKLACFSNKIITAILRLQSLSNITDGKLQKILNDF